MRQKEFEKALRSGLASILQKSYSGTMRRTDFDADGRGNQFDEGCGNIYDFR